MRERDESGVSQGFGFSVEAGLKLRCNRLRLRTERGIIGFGCGRRDWFSKCSQPRSFVWINSCRKDSEVQAVRSDVGVEQVYGRFFRQPLYSCLDQGGDGFRPCTKLSG